MKNSNHEILAINDQSNKVAGFITAISDWVLTAYIPLLEVLPEIQNQGIGQELVSRILNELKEMYMIDICCDDDLVPFYEKFGMSKSNGMLLRNYNRQSGRISLYEAHKNNRLTRKCVAGLFF